MASITAAQLLVGLHGGAGQITAAATDVASIPTSVMDPVAADAQSLAELVGRVRADLLRTNWSGDGAAVLNDAMGAVIADDDAAGAKRSSRSMPLMDWWRHAMRRSIQTRRTASVNTRMWCCSVDPYL